MKKIMIIEDDTIISKELYELLVNAGYEALILKDFSNAKEEILKSNIDLILLDINIPYQNGEQLLKEIRKETNIPVIMVTSRASETDEILSISYGADDYITKPFIVDELVARVKAHLRREKRRNSIGNNIIKIGEIEIHKDSYEVYLNKELIDLSTREFQLFLYLCENAGQVLSREQIFNSVWGSDFGDIGTVAVNIKSLRDKIDKENKYIKTIWGVGYKLIKPIGEVI